MTVFNLCEVRELFRLQFIMSSFNEFELKMFLFMKLFVMLKLIRWLWLRSGCWWVMLKFVIFKLVYYGTVGDCVYDFSRILPDWLKMSPFGKMIITSVVFQISRELQFVVVKRWSFLLFSFSHPKLNCNELLSQKVFLVRIWLISNSWYVMNCEWICRNFCI